MKKKSDVTPAPKETYRILLDLGNGMSIATAKISSLKEQSQNARLMPKEMFNTLVRNIQNRKQLESLPYCALCDDGGGKSHVEIVSGHHRVRAARSAGMSEIHILLDTTGLTRSKIIAKQLAHNSIAGDDDAVILQELFSRIEDANDKMEAYLSEDVLKLPAKVPLIDTALAVQTNTVTFAFFPRDMKRFTEALDALTERAALSDIMYCLPEGMLEIFKATMDAASAETKIKSPGAAIAAMCQKILDHGGVKAVSGQEEIRFDLDAPHQLSDIMVKLFRQCEVEEKQKNFDGYPVAIQPLTLVIGSAGGMPEKGIGFSGDFLKIDYTPTEPDSYIIPFTGGKDCVAVALKLKSLGKKVELLHVIGMNVAYRDEELANSQRIAAMMDMKLHTAEFFKNGRGPHHGNPVRNMMLLSLAGDLAMKLGFGRIAAGNAQDDVIEEIDYHWGISDSIQMHTAFSQYIHDVTCGGLVAESALLSSETEAYALIARYQPALLDEVAGCMTPKFYRPSHNERNRSKYKVELKPTRCGSCHKCITEFVTLSLLGAVSENQDYFDYCKRRMVERMHKERPNEKAQWTPERCYEHYIDESVIAAYKNGK